MSGPGKIEAYEYPAGPNSPLPAWDGWAAALLEAAPVQEGSAAEQDLEASGAAVDIGLGTEFEQRLAEETRRSFEAGRERGRQEGRQVEREAQGTAAAVAEQGRKRQAAELMEKFAQERNRHLEALEQEVVKLALAVAARILRREAQMDPLLLTGAVRVALGQLAGTAEVHLKVPADDLDLWTEAMRLVPNLALKPTVRAGEGMRLGDCQIETAIGSVDLGIRAQLSEIEKGFFDRAGGMGMEAAANPKAPPNEVHP
jgi:flagellar assembly protein FliH